MELLNHLKQIQVTYQRIRPFSEFLGQFQTCSFHLYPVFFEGRFPYFGWEKNSDICLSYQFAEEMVPFIVFIDAYGDVYRFVIGIVIYAN